MTFAHPAGEAVSLRTEQTVLYVLTGLCVTRLERGTDPGLGKDAFVPETGLIPCPVPVSRNVLSSIFLDEQAPPPFNTISFAGNCIEIHGYISIEATDWLRGWGRTASEVQGVLSAGNLPS